MIDLTHFLENTDMSNKVRARKKPRTRSGNIFSQISPQRIALTNEIKKRHGASVFKSIHHEFWATMMRTSMEMRKQATENYDPTMKGIDGADVTLTYTVGRKNWHSIYIDSIALADFLENSSPRDSDTDIVKQAATDLSESGKEGVAIHLPGRKESIFIASFIVKNRPVVFMFCGEDTGYVPIDDDGVWSRFASSNEGPSDDQWSVVFNLFMYMNAFPSTVESNPPFLVCGSLSGKTQSVVSASNAIKEVYEKSKSSPHIRRGHFRVLRSERFTHKRHQSVFVKPSMVSGSAQTVRQ